MRGALLAEAVRRIESEFSGSIKEGFALNYLFQRADYFPPDETEREGEIVEVLLSGAIAAANFFLRDGSMIEALKSCFIVVGMKETLTATHRAMMQDAFDGKNTEEICKFFKTVESAQLNFKRGVSKRFVGLEALLIEDWIAPPIAPGISRLSYAECSAGLLCELLSKNPDTPLEPPHIFRLKKRLGLVSFDPPFHTAKSKIIAG